MPIKELWKLMCSQALMFQWLRSKGLAGRFSVYGAEKIEERVYSNN